MFDVTVVLSYLVIIVPWLGIFFLARHQPQGLLWILAYGIALVSHAAVLIVDADSVAPVLKTALIVAASITLLQGLWVVWIALYAKRRIDTGQDLPRTSTLTLHYQLAVVLAVAPYIAIQILSPTVDIQVILLGLALTVVEAGFYVALVGIVFDAPGAWQRALPLFSLKLVVIALPIDEGVHWVYNLLVAAALAALALPALYKRQSEGV